VGSARRIGGVLRLAHPFPSILNAAATGAVALLAGGDVMAAARLAASMLCLQASIGALNDVADVGVDATGKPAKPIPSGLVSPRTAMAVAVGAGFLGLALSFAAGPGTAVVAAAGLGLGVLYDVGLSRTRWSWLPLSLALPLLPIHAWLGATGFVPPGLLSLLPVAVAAGAALALANGLVDIERDARAGRRAVAVELGQRRAWLVHASLLAAVAVAAVVVAPGVPDVTAAPPAVGSPRGPIVGIDALRWLRTGGVAAGVVGLTVGVVALAARSARLRERAWELETVSIAAIGLGWLAGTAAVARVEA
jgi:4-hydroxybenzoate polyprenyltransferase